MVVTVRNTGLELPVEVQKIQSRSWMNDDAGIVFTGVYRWYEGEGGGENEVDEDGNKFAYRYSAIFLPPSTDGSTRAT